MKMKRIFAFLLVIIMCLSMCACGAKKTIMDDTELVSNLENTIANYSVKALLVKTAIDFTDLSNMSNLTAKLISVEEAEDGTFLAIGELSLLWIGKDTETVPFTATLSKDENDEYSCDDIEFEYDSSSSLSNELTEEKIKTIVAGALYDAIDSKFDTADAGSTRYEINKTEEKKGYVYVYGNVVLYDKYGKTTTGWRDGSGSAYRSFCVIMTTSGSVYSCEVQ